MKKLVLLAVVVMALVLVALSRVDYGFYNPPRGVVASGRDEVAKDPHERELLRLTITDADVRRFSGQPTLARLSRFHGAEDSLRCSVNRTFNSTDVAIAQRPLRRGMVVTLCLN